MTSAPQVRLVDQHTGTIARPDVVERAEKALEGVTDGPWRFDPDSEYLVGPDGCNVPSYVSKNTEFISAARALVPELVAEVKALRAEVEETEQLRRRVEELEAELADRVSADVVGDAIATACQGRQS